MSDMNDRFSNMVKPLIESFASQDAQFQIELFEETMIACLYCTIEMTRNLNLEERSELIRICVDEEHNQMEASWDEFWGKKGLRFMQHPMYCSMFLIILNESSRMMESISEEDLGKLKTMFMEEQARPVSSFAPDDLYDNEVLAKLLKFKPRNLN